MSGGRGGVSPSPEHSKGAWDIPEWAGMYCGARELGAQCFWVQFQQNLAKTLGPGVNGQVWPRLLPTTWP